MAPRSCSWPPGRSVPWPSGERVGGGVEDGRWSWMIWIWWKQVEELERIRLSLRFTVGGRALVCCFETTADSVLHGSLVFPRTNQHPDT